MFEDILIIYFKVVLLLIIEFMFLTLPPRQVAYAYIATFLQLKRSTMKRFNFKAEIVEGVNDCIQEALPLRVKVQNWEVDTSGSITWAVVTLDTDKEGNCPFHVGRPKFTKIG